MKKTTRNDQKSCFLQTTESCCRRTIARLIAACCSTWIWIWRKRTALKAR